MALFEMCAPRHLREIDPPPAIRAGSIADIDTLCAIDADASALFVASGLDLDLPADHCGPEMLAELTYERRWSPMPHERVVMRKDLDAIHCRP
jgi:hypothetical protein